MESASFLDSLSTIAGVAFLSVVAGTIVATIALPLWIEPISGGGAASLRNVRVPFIVQHEPKWEDLSKALKEFNQKVNTCIVGLSRQLEAAKLREARYGGKTLSLSTSERIETLNTVFDEDFLLLEKLLAQFPVQRALRDGWTEYISITQDNLTRTEESSHYKENIPPPRFVNENDQFSSSYDSSLQVMAHIVRDWTVLGKNVRSSTYGWCQRQIAKKASTILVPGAGLGRLAFNLAHDGHSVEANELSIVMAAATNSIFNQHTKGTIHPFSLDYFVNEADHDWREKAVNFPDMRIGGGFKGSLSFTIGEFVSTYANTYKQYDAIITCFFIDTASNIYDYLAIIHNALKDGGQWIHVGPLQWHLNANLLPSVKELKGISQDFGFSIQEWRVDEDVIDYRMDDTSVRSTKFEGYRPLRVVAVKRERSKPFIIHTSIPVDAPAM